MAKLLICVVNMRTGQGNTARTLTDALGNIQSAVEETQGAIAMNASQMSRDSPFDAIMVAPEYMFIASHATDRLPITANERNWVEAALRALSRKHPRILMIPGTIFYQEPMDAKKIEQAKANALAAEFAARLRANPAALQKGVAKPSQLFENRTPESKGLNVVQVRPIPGPRGRAEELTKFELGDGTHSHWGEKTGLINVVTGLSDKSVRARNRAYVLLGGEVMAIYDKHSDFYEIGKAPDKYFFVPGTTEHCPVIGGFRFGLEICADHRLRVIANRRVDNLDFQVVMSDFIPVIDENISVQVGGYYVHSSSHPTSCQIVGRTPAGLIPIYAGGRADSIFMTPHVHVALVDFPRLA